MLLSDSLSTLPVGISFSSIVDLETISKIGALLGTLVTSAISLWTLREMAKQRRESYKPILLLVASWYRLTSFEDGRFNSKTLDKSNYEANLYIYLANSGRATASNLNISWEFDITSFMKQKFLVSEINCDSNILHVTGKNFEANHVLSNQISEYIPLLLTAENGYEKLLMPSFITALLKVRMDERLAGNSINIPQLKLVVDYQDVGANKNKEQFLLNFPESFQTSNPEDATSQWLHGKIEVSR